MLRYVEGYFERYPGQADLGDYDADVAQRRFEAARRVAYVKAQVSSGSLLEVGAASGHFVAAARAEGFDASGLEPSEAMVERATANYGVPMRAGDLAEFSLSGEQFDVLCAWHVLEHLPRPLTVAQQMRCLVKPGGRLFLEVPNLASIAARREGQAWSHWDPENHVAHYRPETLARLLTGAGFSEVRIDTVSARTYSQGGALTQALNLAHDIWRLRTPPAAHRNRHELMRAFARRPA